MLKVSNTLKDLSMDPIPCHRPEVKLLAVESLFIVFAKMSSKRKAPDQEGTTGKEFSPGKCRSAAAITR